MELFASPLNARYGTFCSAGADVDGAFGSAGSFFTLSFVRGAYLAHPPFIPALVEAMAARTGRDYHFHPTQLWWMWSQEFGKYVVKKLARKAGDWPAYRDFASRSFTTQLDCGDAKMDLGFTPESDGGRFLSRIFDERR